MPTNEKTYFKKLFELNVNDKVENKNGLSYLSWAWAWAEVCKLYPEANYEIVKFNGLPYVFDSNTGYMVYTKVTINGITREMWLPVMDGNNLAMKNEPYEVATKFKKITVKPATMFDINKAIMRCLTKNLAMFGLGLYIYAGEDLPEDSKEDVTPEAKPEPKSSSNEPAKTKYAVRAELVKFCEVNEINLSEVCAKYKLNNSAPDESFIEALKYCQELARRKAYAEAKASAENVLSDYPEEV